LALTTLSALEDALPTLSDIPLQIKQKKLTNSSRQQITGNETKQFSAVLEHPAYKSNPLGAITEHITNSVSLIQKQKQDAKEQNKVARKKEKERQKKKELSKGKLKPNKMEL